MWTFPAEVQCSLASGKRCAALFKVFFFRSFYNFISNPIINQLLPFFNYILIKDPSKYRCQKGRSKRNGLQSGKDLISTCFSDLKSSLPQIVLSSLIILNPDPNL